MTFLFANATASGHCSCILLPLPRVFCQGCYFSDLITFVYLNLRVTDTALMEPELLSCHNLATSQTRVTAGMET